MINFETFLILSAILALAVLVFGLRGSSASKQSPSNATEEETRWRRFRFDAASLYSGKRGAAIAQETPEGVQLTLQSGRVDSLPIKLGDGRGRKAVVQIDPAWIFFKPNQTLLLEGRPWIQIRPKTGRNFPKLEAAKRAQRTSAPSIDSIALQGSLSRREYEMRTQGKLVASVTKKVKDGEQERDGHYYVEIIKSVDPLPYLAMALGLEFAAGRQGAPIQKVKP